ncbi:MAG: UDP-N-acetylmuramoyl-tripeptide--D-alanyl-D-alanine ligase [Candidatus Omnitrophica bacterium]|nr:UDP-N-acetylmuramoyl-tripeptide--D-alanyl-D-alanine ligase [Candidatus Omnitrophota bacterium]
MFTIQEIIDICKGILINQNADNSVIVQGVSIDSRTIKTNDLFIAVRGDNFDGHDYLVCAIEKGAAAVIVESLWAEKNEDILSKLNSPIIAVENTIAALAYLAKQHRKKFSLPVIAVTGSNGKTTTKEMIACVLEAKYKVLKSKASFNNHIGVPLTLLELDSSHQVAVIEIGMNHKGEIRGLAAIACPDIAVITNAANAHLEFFNSISDIIEAKCELLESLSTKSFAIINADCKPLYARAHDFCIDLRGFGIKSVCAYQGSNIVTHSDGIAFTVNGKYTFRLNVLGEHNVYNALAAIAIAQNFEIDYNQIREQLAKFKPVSLRMQIIKFPGADIIADCYNANPDSTMAAINTLRAIQSKAKKIFVFGDMLELGKFSNQAHQQIGKLVAESSISKLITVGEKSQLAAVGATEQGMNKQDVYQCQNVEQAAAVLKKIISQDDVILLKGSRGMHLEKIIDFLNNKKK